MKKLVFVLAFALFAAFSYASHVSLNANSVVIEKVDDEPKKEKAKSSEAGKDSDAKAAKSDKKDGYSSKKKSSCAKTCGSK